MSNTDPSLIHEHHPAPGAWLSWALVALAFAAVGFWLWRARKLRREAEAAKEAAELRARALEEADWRDEIAERRHRRLEISAAVGAARQTPERYERMVEVSRRNIPPSVAPASSTEPDKDDSK